MLNKIYDKKSSLTTPNGKTYTADELRSSGQYDYLFSFECVIEIDDDGCFKSWNRLSDLKYHYGITTEDPEQALVECLAERTRQEQAAVVERATIEDLQAQNEELMLAVAELGALVGGE